MARNSGKFALIAFFLLGIGCAEEPIRIDGSSAASAQSSWNQMLAQASDQTKQKLLVAVVQLNLVGVDSAFNVVSDPGLQRPSVLRIKDKIAGLTANQIIELANRTSTVKVETRSR